MPRFTIEENNPEYRFESGIWKGPSIIPPDGYYKYAEMLLKTMQRNGHLIGQIDPLTGAQDTYGSMADRCIRCALWLKKQGIQSGDILCISTKNHFNAVILLLSSLMIGSILNPWWHHLAKDSVLHVLTLMQPKFVFIEKENAASLKEAIDQLNLGIPIICLQKVNGLLFFDEILAAQSVEEVANFKCTEINSPDQPAVILFTSGTTGQPKATVRSYGALADVALRIPPNIMSKAPGMARTCLEWISGVTYLLTAIRFSATIILYTQSLEPDAFKLIDKYKVQWLGISTTGVTAIVKRAREHNYNFSSVKYISFGGHKVHDSDFNLLIKNFSNATISHSYGSTETGRISQGDNNQVSGSVGKLVKNKELKVIDENSLTIFEPFHSGEFCVRSPNMMLGYYENSKINTDVFDADGWFRTGDVGYFNETGDLFIVDRIRELIKCISYHISPLAIEKIIKEHPGVDEVAVVAKPFDYGEIPIAFVVKQPSIDVTEEEIIALVKQKGSLRLHLMGGVKFMKVLPTTSTGKVNKSVLRQIAKLEEDK